MECTVIGIHKNHDIINQQLIIDINNFLFCFYGFVKILFYLTTIHMN